MDAKILCLTLLPLAACAADFEEHRQVRAAVHRPEHPFLDQAQLRLRELDERLAAVQAELAQVAPEAPASTEGVLIAMQRRREVVAERMFDLREASPECWDVAAADLERALEELDLAIDDGWQWARSPSWSSPPADPETLPD